MRWRAHTDKQTNTRIYPASGLSREIRPLLQHLAYSVYFPLCIWLIQVLLELYVRASYAKLAKRRSDAELPEEK